MQRLALKHVWCFKRRTCEHSFNRPPSTLLTLSEMPKRHFSLQIKGFTHYFDSVELYFAAS